MLNTKEWVELMAMFERWCRQARPYTGGTLEREPKDLWPRQRYYTNDAENNLFISYAAGYAYGKVA